MDKTKLMNKAYDMTKKAYSPINHYLVGAVLVTKDNKLFTGCNIDNMGIQSICAERCAFAKAISEGYNKKDDFKCIFVAGRPDSQEALVKTLPCGYCRQFMSEFVNSNFKIYYYDNGIHSLTIKELLPYSFKL